MNQPSHDFDTERLAAYLEKKIPDFRGPLSAEKFSGGQSNPTFLLKAASGQYVLRRQPPGELLKSAHAVDREYRVIKALLDTPVPVAKAYHLCEEREIIGSMFYVMSYEEGRIFWDPSLPELERSQRSAYYDELIRILAAMHEVDIDKAGLRDYGRPGNYYQRQIALWSKQYRASETHLIEDMEHLVSWLEANCPEDDGQVSLVHGDYRLDNVMFNASSPSGQAVLDWELSTLGHPLADLAYFCMCLRLPADGHILGLAGVDRAAQGVPEERELIRRYCQLRNIESIENWHFYLTFSFFRLAAIAQGVLKRAIDGNASSDKAKTVGALATPLAAQAIEILQQEGVL